MSVLLTQTAKVLANAVIPNEYGIDPAGKLRIGSKICSSLLGKILADLANMRDESLATVNIIVRPDLGFRVSRNICLRLARQNFAILEFRTVPGRCNLAEPRDGTIFFIRG